jgi:Ni,Fe-hydrogenase I cytochrome b subunit
LVKGGAGVKVVLMDERHSVWIRIFHWINMVAIMLLIFTGFYIHAPQSFRLFGNMDGARMVHFAMAYVLCFGVVLRVYYAIAAKDAKNIVFNPLYNSVNPNPSGLPLVHIIPCLLAGVKG